MAFLPTPNVVSAELRCLLDQQRVENTLYFQRLDGWNVSAATSLGYALIEWWQNNIAPMSCAVLSLGAVHVTDQSASDGFAIDVVPLIQTQGEDPNAAVPNNVAICVSFRTQARGRSGRGRNYAMGFPENRVAVSYVEPALVAAYVSAYRELPSVANTQGATWGIVSKQINGVTRNAGLFRPITSVLAVTNVVKTQKRRLPGAGT